MSKENVKQKKGEKKKRNTVWSIASACGILLSLITLYFLFQDITPPTLSIQPDQNIISADADIVFMLQDEHSGIKQLIVETRQSGQIRERIERSFANYPKQHTETLQLNPKRYKDGAVKVTATLLDASLYPFARPAIQSKEYVVDLSPPEFQLSSQPLYIKQGGSALLCFKASEPLKYAGIVVGELFFPAYQQKSGAYCCLFAMPLDFTVADFQAQLVGEDKVGNIQKRLLTVHARAAQYKKDRINISSRFLRAKMSLFRRFFQGDPETDPLICYLKVNSVLRQENRGRLLEIGLQSTAVFRPRGVLHRQPGKQTAGFGERRDYYYGDKTVDKQTHLGVDIASVQNAAVGAAAGGVVVLAEFYGIYGNCVIVDHGLGLQTLYSHLSKIMVHVGDTVYENTELGQTGTTGLAGGDHLHFGVLVSGVPVNPQEWWDKHWVQKNILDTMRF